MTKYYLILKRFLKIDIYVKCTGRDVKIQVSLSCTNSLLYSLRTTLYFIGSGDLWKVSCSACFYHFKNE